MRRLFSSISRRLQPRTLNPERQIQEVKTRNLEFANNINKDVLAENKAMHSPTYFVLTCVDSRIMPANIMGMDPGDVLVHRNIANRAPNEDLSVKSAVTFATQVLGVKHLIVMGHQDCGGLINSLTNNTMPFLGDYLKGVREIYETHKEEIDGITDKYQKHTRMAEHNALLQAKRVWEHPVVQSQRAQTGYPKVHAMVYLFDNGLLKDLDFEAYIAEEGKGEKKEENKGQKKEHDK